MRPYNKPGARRYSLRGTILMGIRVRLAKITGKNLRVGMGAGLRNSLVRVPNPLAPPRLGTRQKRD